MSEMDLTKVGGLAYNPTPLGFGTALAMTALGGKTNGKHEQLTPSYENGQYYVTGNKGTPKHLVDTSNYQIGGDAGNYNLVPFAGNSEAYGILNKSIMPSLADNSYTNARQQLIGDTSALSQFDSNFGAPDMNRNANMVNGTVYANQNIAPSNFVRFGQQSQSSPVQSAIQKSVYGNAMPIGRNQNDFGLVAQYAMNNNHPSFSRVQASIPQQPYTMNPILAAQIAKAGVGGVQQLPPFTSLQDQIANASR